MKEHRYTLRIDKETWEKLLRIAKEEHRSINNMIVVLIRRAVKEFEAKTADSAQ